MRKVISLLGVLSFVVLLGAGCSGSVSTDVTPPAETTSLETYQNQANGFEIGYQDDWTKKEGVYGTVVAFVSPQDPSDGFAENLTVSVKPTEATAEQYVQSAVTNAPKSYTDFKLIESKAATLAGEPAQMITYTFTEGDLKVETRELFAAKNGKMYDVTFTASQDNPTQNWDVAEKMIATFKITQ